MSDTWSSAPRPVFIFDGDCGFCTSSAGLLRRFFDPRVRYAIAAYQRLDLSAYGLSEADCDAAAQFVTADGSVHAGHRSVAQALRHSLPVWRPVGLALTLPGLDTLAAVAYAWVAAHRGMLPAGTPACAVQARPARDEGAPHTGGMSHTDEHDTPQHHHRSAQEREVASMGSACAVTVSDRSSDGTREDTSGRLLIELLTAAGFEVSGPVIVPDGQESVAGAISRAVSDGALMVVTTGGTGIGPRDLTPEASRTLITRDMPGMAELLRREGAKQTPYAAVSRGMVGVIDRPDRPGGTLLVNLPGRPAGVQEGLDVLVPLLPHVLAQLRGHDH